MKHRSFTQFTVLFLIAATAVFSITACGAGAKSSYSADTAAETTAAMSAGGGQMKAAADIAPEAAPIESNSGEKKERSSSSPTQPTSSQRKLIRTINLRAETTEFDTLIDSVNQSVTELGGYLESSDISGSSLSSSYEQQRYAYLIARIPSSQLENFLSQVSSQSNIINRSETTQDVTLQYSDVESRKKSLTIEQERLWVLLEKADSIDAVIALESRLSDIRYQLESLESQLRTYDNQVDYSTVHLTINEVTVFTPTAPDSLLARIQKGFLKNMEHVGNALTNTVVWFITFLPVLLVLAILFGSIFLIAKFILKQGEKRKKKKDEIKEIDHK